MDSARNRRYLRPIYDSAKSFYQKASWEIKDGDRVLYSYNT